MNSWNEDVHTFDERRRKLLPQSISYNKLEMEIKEQKKILRENIWRLLEEKGVVRFPLPLKNRIPNFEGSD